MAENKVLGNTEIGGASGKKALSAPQIDAYWGSCDCCVCGCVSAQLCQQRRHKCCIQV